MGGLWRILCSQSIIEEVLQFSFSNPIFPFHFSKRFLWSHSNSLSLFSSNSFRGLFSLTSRQCIRILLTSILMLFFFGESRNLTTLCLLFSNGFSLSFFFLSFLSFLWIGAQFPSEKFLSYGRILTL